MAEATVICPGDAHLRVARAMPNILAFFCGCCALRGIPEAIPSRRQTSSLETVAPQLWLLSYGSCGARAAGVPDNQFHSGLRRNETSGVFDSEFHPKAFSL